MGRVDDHTRSRFGQSSERTQFADASVLTLNPTAVVDDEQVNNGFMQQTDHTTEALNRNSDTQATGFICRPSLVAWLHSLQTRMDQHGEPTESLGRSKYLPIMPTNYFLDNLQMPTADPSDYPDWPPKELATLLVKSYFQTVHASFPFIGKIYFLQQFRAFYMEPDTRPGREWFAVFNLILAIALRHAALLETELVIDVGTHTLYFS